jgi:hypothetical protein
MMLAAPRPTGFQGRARGAIMAKDLDGTGITVNVLVPGGVTNAPMISDEAGFDRAKLIQPDVMVPPLLWLVSNAAGKVTGRRFLGIYRDPALPPEQAAERAGAPVACPGQGITTISERARARPKTRDADWRRQLPEHQRFRAWLDSEPRRLPIAIRVRGSCLECHTLAAPAVWLQSQPANSAPPNRQGG